MSIELVLIALMLVASLNFARHFVALRRLSLEPYVRDPEFKAIFALLAVSIVVIAAILTWHSSYPTFFVTLRHSMFHVVSAATTTGLFTQNVDA